MPADSYVSQRSDRQDELELLRRFRAGDEAAFRELLARHGNALSARIRRNLPRALSRRVAVSDVLQESCVVAYRRRETFEVRGEDAFRNWLLGIVDNKVKEAVRRHQGAGCRSARREVSRHERVPTGLFVGGAQSPSKHAEAREALQRTHAALARLPEDYERVLILTRIEGLTLREAGERMGRSREAMKKLYGRAVCRLKTTFEEMNRAGTN